MSTNIDLNESLIGQEVKYILLEAFAREAVQSEKSPFYGLSVPESVPEDVLESLVEAVEDRLQLAQEHWGNKLSIEEMVEETDNAIFSMILHELGMEDISTNLAAYNKLIERNTGMPDNDEKALRRQFEEAVYDLKWDWNFESLDERRAEIQKIMEGIRGPSEEIREPLVQLIKANENKANGVVAFLIDVIEDAFEDSSRESKNRWMTQFARAIASMI